MIDKDLLREIASNIITQAELLADEVDSCDDPKYPSIDTLSKDRVFSEEENLGLPLPRLEIRTYKSDRGWMSVYYVVTRHLLGFIQATPRSWTNCNGGYEEKNPIIDPFRDGAHIRHDMQTMTFPGFFVNHDSGEAKPVNLDV